ncbi:MAG: 30S ribosomal protein S2 [Bdellovibrionales bacterium]|nr:30S ribosomal protein S2 [Bdellovibrionales bacterium]
MDRAGSQETVVRDRPKAEINLQTLLKAGVHFGHQSSRWHPKMDPFIYTTRNGIHIIDLPKTIQSWKQTRKHVVEIAARGGSVLFVGTKKQAQSAVIEEAKRCGAYYVARRWLGGMMTNFRTIRNSIERMKKLETLLGDAEQRLKYKKKELLMMDREREKLEFSLAGIRDMYAPPQLMFIIDVKREEIAVSEASRLDIPVVALVDTNSDPTTVDYPIPSNDDATRAIRLFCQAIADAVIEGKEIYAQRARSARAVDQVAAEAAAEAAAAVADASSAEEAASSAKAENAGSDAE